MKPNKPIDRESLLHLVRQSLHQANAAHVDTTLDQTDGPLGLAVRKVMATLSSHPNNSAASLKPVPLFEIAAYVDGTLEDPKQVHAITIAASSDPGLMMEIVSAISAREHPSQPPLSQDLRSRLIGLQRQPNAANNIESDQVAPIVAKKDSRSNAMSIAVTPKNHPNSPRQNRLRRSRGVTLGLAATAAALLLGVGWWLGSTFNDRETPVANENQNIDTDAPREDRLSVPSDDSILAESPLPPADPIVVPKPKTAPTLEEDVANEMPLQKIANDPTPKQDPTPGTIIETPRGDESPKKPTRLVADWNQIDGLLLQSVARGEAPASSSSSTHTKRAVTEGTTLELAGSGTNKTLQLQTLPLCRASATLAGGDKLVLAADTQVQLADNGLIHLQHGSLALIASAAKAVGSETPDGETPAEQPTLWFGQNLATSLPIQSRSGAAVLIRKTTNGLEIDITGSSVQVGQQTYSNSRLHIDDTSLAVQRVDDAPDRLPRWTRQRVDRIELPRTVLAQFASSSDIQATMMQTLRSGTVQGKSAATIRGWLVSSSSDNLHRLLASQDPLIRDAVMNHLRTVTPNDPRHRELWRRLQASSSNPRVFVAIRSYFVDLWSNQRPNTTRRDQLVRMIQSNEVAPQVAANYLLTAFYGPGPPFQLGANANTKSRAVNAWRTVISRIQR